MVLDSVTAFGIGTNTYINSTIPIVKRNQESLKKNETAKSSTDQGAIPPDLGAIVTFYFLRLVPPHPLRSDRNNIV